MSTSTASSSGVGGTPSNPWDMDVTRRLLQQRIDSGEITSADVDLFRRGYRWIMLSTGLGALAGLPVWWAMSRRRPPPSLASKLATSFFLSSTGSFLGFTVGGAAAALEVNNNMQDSRRKVKVFEEVMMQSKRIAEDRRAGRPISLPEVGSGSGMDGDGSVEGSWQSSSSAVAPGADGPRSLGIREEARNASGSGEGSAWDRLRKGEQLPPSSPAASNAFFPASASAGRSTDPSNSPGQQQQQQRKPSLEALEREAFGRSTTTSSGSSIESKLEEFSESSGRAGMVDQQLDGSFSSGVPGRGGARRGSGMMAGGGTRRETSGGAMGGDGAEMVDGGLDMGRWK